jgi:hypothetical protein
MEVARATDQICSRPSSTQPNQHPKAAMPMPMSACSVVIDDTAHVADSIAQATYPATG